ncbi:MAG: elongation factor Ts [Bacteroidales bacterium]|nr:elongation factor Ts [Bacteroidales bacterium]MBQ3658858.1 elongation factor Ts [Bacteroidales bacterium]MBQ7458168.1 elongation factor Ts [Bacteroidales bacterium]MBQ9529406.1 elongation factor Ts [Bacteroidales bacterium]
MEIKAVDVAKLRKMTGAGMMDCKKALVEAEGDFNRAQEIIREKGKLVAAKRADRETTEGAVIARIAPDGKTAILVALGCETDFVSATAEFKSIADAVADTAMAALPEDKAALENTKMANGQTVAEFITEQAAKCGEKHAIAYYAKMQAAFIGSYIHFTHKDGAIVGFNKEVSADLAKHIAMQVTSMKPVAVDEASVPEAVVKQELEVAVEKTKEEQIRKAVDNALKKAGINPAHCDSDDHISSNTAKGWLTEAQAAQAREIIATVSETQKANLNEGMIQNIAKGRLAKFFKEQTLENQEFVMEGKISVKDYIKSVDPEAKVTAFCRFSLSD